MSLLPTGDPRAGYLKILLERFEDFQFLVGGEKHRHMYENCWIPKTCLSVSFAKIYIKHKIWGSGCCLTEDSLFLTEPEALWSPSCLRSQESWQKPRCWRPGSLPLSVLWGAPRQYLPPICIPDIRALCNFSGDRILQEAIRSKNGVPGIYPNSS